MGTDVSSFSTCSCVCVVYRVRPCPLYRVISWVSKHIHSVQVLGECPSEVHSPFIHPLSSAVCFLKALLRPVCKRPPPSTKRFTALDSSLCQVFSLLRVFELEEVQRAAVVLFVFDSSDSHKIGFKPLDVVV